MILLLQWGMLWQGRKGAMTLITSSKDIIPLCDPTCSRDGAFLILVRIRERLQEGGTELSRTM